MSRLRSDTQCDVRDASARDTWRLVSLATRGSAPAASGPMGPSGGGVSGSAAGGGGGGGGLLQAAHLGDYFTVAGGEHMPERRKQGLPADEES